MNKFNFLYLAFGLCLIAFIISGSSNGVADVQGVDRTGSPISLAPCSSCHSGGNFGTTFTIEVSDQATGLPITAYTPGAFYDVEYRINTNTGSPQAFGFQSVAMMGPGNVNAGTFSSPATNTEFHTLGNGRTYVEHASDDPSNIFSAVWQAPASGSGAVNFYGVGNAVNGNGVVTGDHPSVPVSISINETPGCLAPDSLWSVVSDDDVVLNWLAAAGATGYEITGGPVSAPNAVTLTVGAITSLPVNNLTRNVTYVWKIKAICGGDVSTFSASDQFFIPPIICDPPASISSVVTGNSVTLSWTPSPNAIGYTINGGPTTAPTAVSLDVSGGGASSFTVNNLNAGGYAWRIRAVCSVNPSIVSAFTAFDQFTIISPPQKASEGLFGNAGIVDNIKLHLYPNPTDHFVNISIENSIPENTEIELYNVNGQRVNIEQPKGDNSIVRINTSDLPDGIYQVVVRSENSVNVERLVIAR